MSLSERFIGGKLKNIHLILILLYSFLFFFAIIILLFLLLCSLLFLLLRFSLCLYFLIYSNKFIIKF